MFKCVYIRFARSSLFKGNNVPQVIRYRLKEIRTFCQKTDRGNKSADNHKAAPALNKPLSLLDKYSIFKDEDSSIILDVQEERFKASQEEEPESEFVGLRLERGTEGVYDIEDLVELLRREKAEKIFVAKIPAEYGYVDYLVIVSGRSSRHMTAIAEFVKRVYKKKRHANDLIPKIEGEESNDWMAMDLGNIALHILSERARKMYDLESLWSLGSEFDELSNLPDDPVTQILKQHSVYLGDLQPASTPG